MTRQTAASACLQYMADVMNRDFHFSDDDINHATEQRLAMAKRQENQMRQPTSPTATLHSEIASVQQSCSAISGLHDQLVAAESRAKRAEEALMALRLANSAHGERTGWSRFLI